MTYALEAAAVAIGLVGLSSAFGALVLARRREFGVLRHLGMTRAQIGTMLATEGVVASGVGLVVGVILIVGGLTFFPALALGPLVEQFAMNAGTVFSAN